MAVIISNIVARLSADTGIFDRNMARARQSLRGFTSDAGGLRGGFSGLALTAGKVGLAIAATGVAIGWTRRTLSSLVAPTIANEQAERKLAIAIELSRQDRKALLPVMEQHAEKLADLTRYTREEILSAQALGTTMGAQADELQGMTEAAIGLASAYDRDLGSAMKTIALARQGETGQLKEIGVVLDRTKSKHEQYAELLEKQRQNLRFAEEDTKTLGGSIEQLSEEWGLFKDAMLRPYAGPVAAGLRMIRTGMEGVSESAQKARRGLKDVVDAAAEFSRSGAASLGISAVGQGFGPGLELNLGQPMGPVLPQRPLAEKTPPPPVIEPIPERIAELNRELRERIDIAKQMAAGDQFAAERVRVLAAAEDEYAGNVKKATAVVQRYENGLARLAEILRSSEVAKYNQNLEDQNAVLRDLASGHERQARITETINDLRREGIELNGQERRRIEDLTIENEKLSNAARRRMDQQRQWMDVVNKSVEGFADASARALVYGEKFSDLLRQLAMDIAYTAVKNTIYGGMTAGLGALGLPIPMMHSGGTAGGRSGPTRMVSPAALAAAPRLHGGLASDEFPAILQRGEEVKSRAGVASDGRQMAVLIDLVRELVAKPPTHVAVVRDREEIYAALRHPDGHRLVAEIQARNG